MPAAGSRRRRGPRRTGRPLPPPARSPAPGRSGTAPPSVAARLGTARRRRTAAGHRGVDLAAAAGAPVTAVAAGRVSLRRPGGGTRGRLRGAVGHRHPAAAHDVRAGAGGGGEGDEVRGGRGGRAPWSPGAATARRRVCTGACCRGDTYLDPLSLLPPCCCRARPGCCRSPGPVSRGRLPPALHAPPPPPRVGPPDAGRGCGCCRAAVGLTPPRRLSPGRRAAPSPRPRP